ncbi:hypothetical protein CYMTET_16268 [Cymbomonas tetramitiformis]|uniref:JmjC domain-containing protein n=1 Tax=Cymbomonas tetramitiformis TaxID=36881 RepID=A0AAE0L8C0_9CHLO|nr:hypothetical protein CYMTET_16268 [Cymbomonas tetramitiformis]
MKQLCFDFGINPGELVEVFIAGTTDGAGKELNAFAKELDIPCKVCLGHRLNSAVQWSTGIAGTPPSAKSQGTIRNPKMRLLIGRVAGLVGHFAHSPKATGKFKAVMLALYDDFQGLESRNDTRWSSTFKMLAKVWRLRTAISVYFNIHDGDNKVQLTLFEWNEVRACIGVLEAHHDVHIDIQGGRTSFVASTIEALAETRAMVNSSTFELSTVQGCELSPMGEVVNEEDPQYELVELEDLPEVAQILVTVLREKYEEYDLGVPITREDRICCALHPTFPWQDQGVRAQAFKELAEELEKARPFFEKVKEEEPAKRDPERSPEQKKAKVSARERFREQLAKRKLVSPGTQQTDGSGTEAVVAAPSAQASTEVDRYKYLLDNNLFEIDPDQHLGQVWVKPENKKNFPVMHVVGFLVKLVQYCTSPDGSLRTFEIPEQAPEMNLLSMLVQGGIGMCAIPIVGWILQSKRKFSKVLGFAVFALWCSFLWTIHLSKEQQRLEKLEGHLRAASERGVAFNRRWEETEISQFRVERLIHMDPETFSKDYEKTVPFILENATAYWPARSAWSFARMGKTSHRKVRLKNGKKLGNFIDLLQNPVNQYTRQSCDPKYSIIDNAALNTFPDLQLDYLTPPFCALGAPSANFLPRLMGRMKHFGSRYLILGNAGGGASFHKDFWNTAFWNAVVHGRKRWVLIPPSESLSIDRLAAWHSMSALEWFEQAYPQVLSERIKHYSFNANAGDLLFVPASWWHVTLNLEPSVGVSENMLTDGNFPIVFNTAICLGFPWFKISPGTPVGYSYMEKSYTVQRKQTDTACSTLNRMKPDLVRLTCCVNASDPMI